MSKLIRQKIDVSPLRVRPVRDREELLTLLRAKLLEESFEAFNASATEYDASKLRDEFADVLEVLKTLANEHGFRWSEIEAATEYKYHERGGLLPGRVYS